MPLNTDNVRGLHDLLMKEIKENSSLISRLTEEICKTIDAEENVNDLKEKVKKLEYSLKKSKYGNQVAMEQTIMKTDTDGLLMNAPLYFPSAKVWMWSYCTYLGPYTDKNGVNYDLGIYAGIIPSLAIVYGNEPGEYISGDVSKLNCKDDEICKETLKRAKAIGLIKE